MPQQIQLRRGVAANWTSANPTLAAGEAGFETDTNNIKFGDGVTAWNSLAYFVGSAGNSFGTIAVSGQSDVVADTAGDTVTLVAGSNITITTNAGTDSVTIASSGGVSDGDKGDIVVSASGTVWTIDSGVVTFAKMQTVGTNVILGNDGSGTAIEALSPSTARTVMGAAASGANTDLTSVYLNNTGLKLKDTNASHGLIIAPGSDITADRTLTVTTGDSDRTITLTGNTSLTGTNTGDQNLFSTIAVSGQSDVVADSTSDTLTLVAGSNVTITTNAATDTITISASTGGVSDGDKGDITVSSSGTVWTIDNDVVTYAKIQNVSATDKVLGRVTAGAGDIEEITCTAAGRALIDDADAAAQRTTLGAAASGANTDIASVYLNNTGLKLKDTNASHGLIVAPGSDLTADRTLTVTTGDSDRTLTLTGNASISGTNTGDQTSIVGITGTLAQFNTACTDANFQPEDATLTAFAALTIAAESLTIGTGADAFTQVTFAANTFPARASTGSLVAKTITDFALTILDDTNGAGVRGTIGAAASGANTDLTSVYLNNTGLKIKDTNASHGLTIAPGSDITADRTLTVTTGDADRTITLNGNTTLSGTNTGDQTSIVGITGTIAQFNTACTDANFQPEDATLTAFAALTIAADSLTIGTGADAFSQTTFAANTFPARASTGSLVAKTITDFGLSLVDDANAATARATVGLDVFDVSFFYPTVADGTVTLNAKASFAGTINQIRGLKTSSGTCTVAVQINGTNVTGLSSLAVTSTPQDATASAANTFAVGDRITVVITSNSSGLNLEASLKYTR